MAVNRGELDILGAVADIQIEHGDTPLATVLVPMRLGLDLLQLDGGEGYLHDIVSEFEVLVQLSDCFEQIFLRELILMLQVLDLGLCGLVLLSELAYHSSHVVDLLLQTLVLPFN